MTGHRPMARLAASAADDRGASLALVAVSLMGMIGLLSLVIDMGDGWLSRQRLIPATDAAALAAAQDMVDRPWDKQGACATARAYVLDNAPDATTTDCAVTLFGSSGGRVTVSASENFESLLTDVSNESGSIGSVSTATWGWPNTVSALRPLSLCYDGSAVLRDLIDNPRPGPVWVEIVYTKDDPLACGGEAALGNYATIDFDGGTPMHEIRDWMLNGYPGQVDFDPLSVVNCEGNAVCLDRPYASNDIRPELYAIKNSQRYVAFPIFNYSDATKVHLVGMIRARLYAFDLDGSTDTWSIELKVDPGLISGTCCGPPSLVAGNQVIAICGVDADAYQACQPSNGS